MLTIIYVIRSATVVLGIAAFANLIDRVVTNSSLREYLVLNQREIPGSLYFASVLEHFTYPLAVLIIANLFAGFYWRDLFPDRLRWSTMALALVAGIGFAMFINHPVQEFFFNQVYGQSALRDTKLANSAIAATLPALAAIIAIPFVEELTHRGIMFREGERLPIWLLSIVSFLVFALSQFASGGLAKVILMTPAATLFIATRVLTKSFIYSAAAHIGLVSVAVLKLQLW